MASYARCLSFFFLLAISFSLQIQARDSKFFSQFSKENPESISIAPVGSPELAPAPAPEPEVAEHGYGLYGSESYRYPPTTSDPVKATRLVGEEKYVPAEEFEMGYSNNNFHGNGNEKQGMSDTRFLENGKYYYNANKGNGNGYVNEKQGLSDTRFLENGKYYYDVHSEVGKDENVHFNNNNNYNNFNEYKNEHFETEKPGLSDTRLLENGKYHFDVNNNENNNYNYNYNYNHENVGLFDNGNEYINGYNGKEHYNGNNNGYNYNPNEYAEERSVKKLPPNEYDTIEEYEKEQEYKESQNEYVP